jgi:hypothetical protein
VPAAVQETSGRDLDRTVAEHLDQAARELLQALRAAQVGLAGEAAGEGSFRSPAGLR